MRLEITRKTDLALKAMIVLGRTEARCKGNDLAERIDTTASFISQVMAPLVRKGWVESEPGRNGGYRRTTAVSCAGLHAQRSRTVRCTIRGRGPAAHC